MGLLSLLPLCQREGGAARAGQKQGLAPPPLTEHKLPRFYFLEECCSPHFGEELMQQECQD